MLLFSTEKKLNFHFWFSPIFGLCPSIAPHITLHNAEWCRKKPGGDVCAQKGYRTLWANQTQSSTRPCKSGSSGSRRGVGPTSPGFNRQIGASSHRFLLACLFFNDRSVKNEKSLCFFWQSHDQCFSFIRTCANVLADFDKSLPSISISRFEMCNIATVGVHLWRTG